MINAPRSWDIETEYKDIGTINMWTEVKEAAEKEDPKWLQLGTEGEGSGLILLSNDLTADASAITLRG